MNLGYFKFGNCYGSVWDVNLLANTRKFIKPFSVLFQSGKHGRLLLYFSYKQWDYCIYFFRSQIRNIESLVNFSFKIKTWSGCAQSEGSCIFFFLSLISVDFLGEFS